ncbi:hypothetical protein MKW98_010260 [Papaver atlanticum]|uniref:Uncharacterized protein n=1 Tax=Papaver atlanticum TaxID=357466 RepID=A0AAD4XGW3_9MAGN|nr:hypothetical protein MKW98_010260 [Papaver atlanticum]
MVHLKQLLLLMSGRKKAYLSGSGLKIRNSCSVNDPVADNFYSCGSVNDPAAATFYSHGSVNDPVANNFLSYI